MNLMAQLEMRVSSRGNVVVRDPGDIEIIYYCLLALQYRDQQYRISLPQPGFEPQSLR